MKYSKHGESNYWQKRMYFNLFILRIVLSVKLTYCIDYLRVKYTSAIMGGFFDFVGDAFNGIKDGFSGAFNGIKGVGEGVFNSVIKPVYSSVLKPVVDRGVGFFNGALNRVDKISGAADKVIDATGNAVDGIGSFLGGNSNILLYIVAGGAALIVLPKLVDRLL